MKRFHRAIVRSYRLLVGVSLLCTGALDAQKGAALQVGARIGINVMDSTCTPRPWRRCVLHAGLAATLVRVTPDTLVVQYGPTTVLAIPRVPEQRIFVRERESRMRSAVRSAALYGATAGMLIPLTDASHRSRVRVTAGLALSGLALGALLPANRWRRATP